MYKPIWSGQIIVDSDFVIICNYKFVVIIIIIIITRFLWNYYYCYYYYYCYMHVCKGKVIPVTSREGP
jgi:hypothetical protein